jgi:hypothetical protein
VCRKRCSGKDKYQDREAGKKHKFHLHEERLPVVLTMGRYGAWATEAAECA